MNKSSMIARVKHCVRTRCRANMIGRFKKKKKSNKEKMFYFILNPFDYIIIIIEEKNYNIYTINVPFLLIIYVVC